MKVKIDNLVKPSMIIGGFVTASQLINLKNLKYAGDEHNSRLVSELDKLGMINNVNIKQEDRLNLSLEELQKTTSPEKKKYGIWQICWLCFM